jgi:hypothetical protein
MRRATAHAEILNWGFTFAVKYLKLCVCTVTMQNMIV